MFVSLSNFGTPPEVRDSLVFRYTLVYFADHDERKHVGEDGNGSAKAMTITRRGIKVVSCMAASIDIPDGPP